MKIQVASTPPTDVEADALVIGMAAETKSLPPRLAALDKAVADLIVLSPDGRSTREVGQGARTGEIFARATWFARDLINAPANDVHPTYLAKVATDLAKETGLTATILDRAECQKLGMGAFLGVAAGSEQPPRFIHLT